MLLPHNHQSLKECEAMIEPSNGGHTNLATAEADSLNIMVAFLTASVREMQEKKMDAGKKQKYYTA